jgi:hypothetical protein
MAKSSLFVCVGGGINSMVEQTPICKHKSLRNMARRRPIYQRGGRPVGRRRGKRWRPGCRGRGRRRRTSRGCRWDRGSAHSLKKSHLLTKAEVGSLNKTLFPKWSIYANNEILSRDMMRHQLEKFLSLSLDVAQQNLHCS